MYLFFRHHQSLFVTLTLATLLLVDSAIAQFPCGSVNVDASTNEAAGFCTTGMSEQGEGSCAIGKMLWNFTYLSTYVNNDYSFGHAYVSLDGNEYFELFLYYQNNIPVLPGMNWMGAAFYHYGSISSASVRVYCDA